MELRNLAGNVRQRRFLVRCGGPPSNGPASALLRRRWLGAFCSDGEEVRLRRLQAPPASPLRRRRGNCQPGIGPADSVVGAAAGVGLGGDGAADAAAAGGGRLRVRPRGVGERRGRRRRLGGVVGGDRRGGAGRGAARLQGPGRRSHRRIRLARPSAAGLPAAAAAAVRRKSVF